jgi:OFA family oxalate/formate antiporter-like MFS transporter
VTGKENPDATLLIVISAIVGANYGSNLALFPSITKDFFGLKNFGVNYGLVFTAWGVGGFSLALLAGKVFDKYKTFNFAFYTSIVLLIVAGVMVFLVKTPRVKATVEADAPAAEEKEEA